MKIFKNKNKNIHKYINKLLELFKINKNKDFMFYFDTDKINYSKLKFDKSIHMYTNTINVNLKDTSFFKIYRILEYSTDCILESSIFKRMNKENWKCEIATYKTSSGKNISSDDYIYIVDNLIKLNNEFKKLSNNTTCYTIIDNIKKEVNSIKEKILNEINE